MKEIKGRLFKKLKSIKQIGISQKERLLHVNASDGWFNTFTANSGYTLENPSLQILSSQEAEVGEEDDTRLGSSVDKENIRPNEFIKVTMSSRENSDAEVCNSIQSPSCNPSFWLQGLNSECLSAPSHHKGLQKLVSDDNKAYDIQKTKRKDGTDDHLSEFEKRSPPGGENCVILYTTTIRGVRKTFDECNMLRFLLRSLRVAFQERDVSMHMEFREELWNIMGGRSLPPRLFIKGRYIGEAEEVLRLHEEGKLRQLVEDIPLDRLGGICDGCGGMRFLICSECNGCCKLTSGEQDSDTRCQSCNENGLVVCSLCCSIAM